MYKILVVDDHAMFRKGLKRIFEETPDMEVAGEAANGQEALANVRENDFDLVLMDISMPGWNGMDVLKELKAKQKRLPVLLLSMHPEEQFAVRALRAGASGYLTKDSEPEELIRAIRLIMRGKKYISPTLSETLAAGLGLTEDRPLHSALSDREYQVLCRIASGKTVGAIAVEMTLSPQTVSTYRARILQKMGLKTSAELTHYAISNRLVD